MLRTACEFGELAIYAAWGEARACSRALAVSPLSRTHRAGVVYTNLQRQLSRGILLGLEFLVAADIIRTVAVEPTFRSVGVLGLIVLVRTFLSFTLEVEVTGRWPWQRPVGSTRERAA